jgi:hypothetical protein
MTIDVGGESFYKVCCKESMHSMFKDKLHDCKVRHERSSLHGSFCVGLRALMLSDVNTFSAGE